MAIEIEMPRLSDTMESGTLVKWYVNEGDAVEPDQVLADIETDKATMEMPTYDAGVLARILVQPGESVDVGGVLCVLAEEGESADEVAAKYASGGSGSSAAKPTASAASNEGGDDGDASSSDATSTTTATMDPPTSSTPASTAAAAGASGASNDGSGSGNGNGGRMAISPLARRLAEERGVDLSSIKGSGPGGRIVKRDILNAPSGGSGQAAATGTLGGGGGGGGGGSSAPAPMMTSLPTLGGTVPLSNMRQTIARRLVESKTTIPHYQVSVSIDVDPLLDLRRTLNEQLDSQGVKLSVNDFLVRACALSIYDHPMFNAIWKDTSLEINDKINVGVAVSLPDEKGGGLVVATIYDADRKGLRQISAETKMLAGKARDRGLSIEEMSNSTFTISNLGMFGVDFFTAIVNPPNSAILAVGGAMERPVVRDGEIVIGHEMSCTLSLDHRIIDGASAARFLQTLKSMLENPATLLV